MDIIIGIITSIVLIGASYIFLYVDKKEEGHTKKKLVYHGVMLALLIVLVLVLHFVYPAKSLVSKVKLIALIGALVVLAWKDFYEYIIPNIVVLVMVGIRFLFFIWEFISYGQDFFLIVKDSFIACLGIGLFLIIVHFLMKDSIGMGDIKLLMVMALYQGFAGIFSSIFFSLVIICIASIVLLIMKKKGRKDVVPFAPAVLVGTYLSAILTGM